MRSALLLLTLCLLCPFGLTGWSSETSIVLFNDSRSGEVGGYFYDYPLTTNVLPPSQIGYVQITFSCDAYSIPDYFTFFGPQGDQHTIGMASGGWTQSFTYPLSVLNSHATVSVWAPEDGTAWIFSISAVAKVLDTRVVDSQVPQVEPPPSDCEPKRFSRGNSRIDNLRQAHIHDAIDWSLSADPKACSTCSGGVSRAGGPEPLTVHRWHRYRDFGWRGSFGPGVFTDVDQQIRVYGRGATTSATVEWFDPAADGPMYFTGTGQVAGTLIDAKYSSAKHCLLKNASGLPAADMLSVRSAIITRWDGTVITFEVVPASDIATSDGFGR